MSGFRWRCFIGLKLAQKPFYRDFKVSQEVNKLVEICFLYLRQWKVPPEIYKKDY